MSKNHLNVGTSFAGRTINRKPWHCGTKIKKLGAERNDFATLIKEKFYLNGSSDLLQSIL